jgi:TRAP-type C4-dicarboxylate transport system permease small subunit
VADSRKEDGARASDKNGGADGSSGPDADVGRQLEEFTKRFELADPDADLPLGDRIVNKSVEFVGIVALAAVFLIIFASTIGRYFFNRPIIWGEEVVLGIIPWMVAIGLFLSARRRQLVRVEFVASKFPPALAQVAGAIGQIVSIAAFAYIAWSAIRYVGFFGADKTPFLRLPRGLSTSAYIFAGGATSLAFAVGFIRATLARDWIEKGR